MVPSLKKNSNFQIAKLRQPAWPVAQVRLHLYQSGSTELTSATFEVCIGAEIAGWVLSQAAAKHELAIKAPAPVLTIA